MNDGQNKTDTQGSDQGPARADSLATGLLFMLSLTVVQRAVGFGRSILFCGMLQDDELGRWSLAFSFLVLAAPLAVLGLPGSFGRYVAYYRQRGQLGTFLRRTIVATVVLAGVALVCIMILAPACAWLVFGDPGLADLVRLLSVALAGVIAFNFVTELLTAMRQVRAVSIMQFVSSILFAAVAVCLLSFTALREEAVIIAFGVSSIVATLVVIGPIRRIGREAIACRARLSQGDLWWKLMPFAAWVWLINLTANLFDVADRFMIVHFADSAATSADALVGQYHSSRVVPYLLVGVAGMVAGVILPYMSHDWEAGDRRAVSHRQALSLKVGGLALTCAGALILLGSPILFTWILRGKYDQGLSVLPWTMTYCVWFSLMTVAQNYLWCAERARLGSLALLIGLAGNIGLNMLLMPRLGLLGAVMATAAANAVTLALVLYFSRRQGLAVDRGMVFCCSLPLMLVLGPLPTIAALLALLVLGAGHHWLFNEQEQQYVRDVMQHYRQTIQTRLPGFRKVCGEGLQS